jgi:hypothetical protein
MLSGLLHSGYIEPKVSSFYFVCPVCLTTSDKLDYAVSNGNKDYNVIDCCRLPVCSKCVMSKCQKHCCVCSKDSNMGDFSKNVPHWNQKFRYCLTFDEMWKEKPFLGPFCLKFYNGLWMNIVKIIQDGNQEQIEALEKRYRSFVNETFRKQYLFFTIRASFIFWTFVRQPSQMQSWYDVLQDTRQFIIRRRNLLNMFQNGFVKMLGKKFSEEKEFTKLGEEIKFRRRFFLSILRRILSKRNQ